VIILKGKIGELLKDLAGWSLVLLGIIGLFVPILQGVLFIFAGLAIVERNKEKKTLDKFKKYLKKRIKKKKKK